MSRYLAGICYGATAGSVLGVIAQNDVMAWVASALAIASAVVMFALNSYHKIREAIREESKADQGDTRELIAQLESRVAHVVPQRDELLAENRQLKATLERVRCRHPGADGAARCEPGSQPPGQPSAVTGK